MTTSNRRREELLVYEFHGLQPPRDEPDDSAFLGIWPEPPYYYLFFAGEPGEGLCRWVSMQQGWVVRDPYRVASHLLKEPCLSVCLPMRSAL